MDSGKRILVRSRENKRAMIGIYDAGVEGYSSEILHLVHERTRVFLFEGRGSALLTTERLLNAAERMTLRLCVILFGSRVEQYWLRRQFFALAADVIVVARGGASIPFFTGAIVRLMRDDLRSVVIISPMDQARVLGLADKGESDALRELLNEGRLTILSSVVGLAWGNERGFRHSQTQARHSESNVSEPGQNC
jgi:hypothetical protein